MVKPSLLASIAQDAFAKCTTVETASTTPQKRWIQRVRSMPPNSVDERVGPAGLVELLRQAGEAEQREHDHRDEVLDPLLEGETDDVVAHRFTTTRQRCSAICRTSPPTMNGMISL